MTKRRDVEGPIQRAILGYLRLKLPGCVVASIPNSTDLSGKRAAIAVAKQKYDGLLPGFPDLACYWCGETLLIEVKAPGNYPSKAQRGVHALLADNGFRVVVARSIDEVEPAVNDMRARHMVRGK